MAPRLRVHSRLVFLSAPESLGASALALLFADALLAVGRRVRLGSLDLLSPLAQVYAERDRDGCPFPSTSGVQAVGLDSLKRFFTGEAEGEVAVCDASGAGRAAFYHAPTMAIAAAQLASVPRTLVIAVTNGSPRAAYAIRTLRAAVQSWVVAAALPLGGVAIDSAFIEPPRIDFSPLALDTWIAFQRLGMSPSVAERHPALAPLHRMRLARWRTQALPALSALGVVDDLQSSLQGAP